MIEISRAGPGNAITPSTWIPLRVGSRRSASLVCPTGHLGTLEDHEISATGHVTPSVVCPAEGCTFHMHVRLVGWGAEA